jgi:hypothetical protein
MGAVCTGRLTFVFLIKREKRGDKNLLFLQRGRFFMPIPQFLGIKQGKNLQIDIFQSISLKIM